MRHQPISMKRRQFLLAGAGGLAALGIPGRRAWAAELPYPTKPITFIFPWPAGRHGRRHHAVAGRDRQPRAGPAVRSGKPRRRVRDDRRSRPREREARRLHAWSDSPSRLRVSRNSAPCRSIRSTTSPSSARTSGQTFGIAVRRELAVQDARRSRHLCEGATPASVTYATAGIGGADPRRHGRVRAGRGHQAESHPLQGRRRGDPGRARRSRRAPGRFLVLGTSRDARQAAAACYVGRGKAAALQERAHPEGTRLQRRDDAPNGVGAPKGLDPAITKRLREVFKKAVPSDQYRKACEKIDAPVMYQDGDDYRKYVEADVRLREEGDRTVASERADERSVTRAKQSAISIIGATHMGQYANKDFSRPFIRLQCRRQYADCESAAGVGPARGGGRADGQSPGASGTQDRGDRDREGRAGTQIRHRHRLRLARHRGRENTSTTTTSNSSSSSANRSSASTCVRSTTCPRPTRDLHGHRAQRRQGRHAQLHRHPVDRELLGDRDARRSPDYFTPERLAEYPNVDGVVAFAHNTRLRHVDAERATSTCCAARWRATRSIRTSRGADRRAGLRAQPGRRPHSSHRACSDGPQLRTLVMQDDGRHARRRSRRASRRSRRCCQRPTRVKRAPVRASHLKIGLQCGGSDGFSSITANPALGARRWTSSCATAAPRSCRRRRRSTASSTC